MKVNRGYQKSFLVDIDGVIIRGNVLIEGAKDFIDALIKGNFPYLFLTNNSYHTSKELSERFLKLGLEIDEDKFYTSAMATASFLVYQKPGCSAYVIGGKGLLQELDKNGIIITSKNPDYVIIGETEEYDYARIIEATYLIQEGAKFIATNPDLTGPTMRGPVPACGALVAPIQKVTGVQPYFLGKPNPAMMYWARKKLNVHSANCFMIGDRMDTDILGGSEAGMTCVLVLSGITTLAMVDKFPYQPDYIYEHAGEIIPEAILSRRERVKD